MIISRPQGAEIPEPNLRACWGRNSDGWGIMFADDGKIVVKKSLNNDEFLDTYREIGDRKMAIHFRLKTHGPIDVDNCHPFPVLTKEEHGIDFYMMHNGTLDLPVVDKTMSDSWHFATQFLRPILAGNPDILKDEYFVQVINKMTGWSKFLFLRGDGEEFFINKSTGIEAFGCWLSNAYSHMPATQVVYSSQGGAPASRETRFRGRDADDDYLYGELGYVPERQFWERHGGYPAARRFETVAAQTREASAASAAFTRKGAVVIPSNTGATGTTTLVKAKAKGGGEKPRVRVRAATQAVPIRGVGGAVLKEILLKGRREVDVRLVHLLAFTHEEIRHLVYDEPAFTAHILCNELSKDMWAQPDSVMTLLFSGTDMTEFRKRVTDFCDKYAWQVRTWIVERVEAMKAPAQDQEKIPY